MEVLAKRLKWLREIKRLSQKEVAAEIKMSLNGYQKIEMDERNPKLEVLIKLSALYNESTDFLLGLTDNTNTLNSKRLLLSDYLDRLSEIKKQVEQYNFRIQQTKLSIEVLNEKLKLKDIVNENYVKEGISSNELDLKNYQKMSQELYNRLFQSQKEFGLLVLDYLESLIEIPNIDILKDLTLRRIMPISLRYEEAKVEDNYERVYFIHSKEIGMLGFISKEFVDKLQERAGSLFNLDDEYLK